MTQKTKTFTVADPLQFDGDPFDVAERACAQASAVARILADTLASAGTMARNAQLTRNLQDTPNDARAHEWEDSPQSKRFVALHKQAKEIEQALDQLSRAASFNPKAPIPKEA